MSAGDWFLFGGVGFVLALLTGSPMWAIAWALILVGGAVLSIKEVMEPDDDSE